MNMISNGDGPEMLSHLSRKLWARIGCMAVWGICHQAGRRGSLCTYSGFDLSADLPAACGVRDVSSGWS